MSILSDLSKKIADHCERHALTKSRFGVLVVNDHKFVSKLSAGAGMGVQRLEAVANYLDCDLVLVPKPSKTSTSTEPKQSACGGESNK